MIGGSLACWRRITRSRQRSTRSCIEVEIQMYCGAKRERGNKYRYWGNQCVLSPFPQVFDDVEASLKLFAAAKHVHASAPKMIGADASVAAAATVTDCNRWWSMICFFFVMMNNDLPVSSLLCSSLYLFCFLFFALSSVSIISSCV